MSHVNEAVNMAAPAEADEECILCHKKHKAQKEEKLGNVQFSRDDGSLTKNGRAFIKADSLRRILYPKNEEGEYVSPLAEPSWSGEQLFNTYKTQGSGRSRRHGYKYQPPPIHGYIAAPHHMVAICCMNGEKGLPGVPRVNPWASKAGYDINGGGNCIFLPSSASQFYVAYYCWKVRGTGRALQGHLGGHRKEYFEEVFRRLELIVDNVNKAGLCTSTSTEEDKKTLADKILSKLRALEQLIFGKLAALKPEENYRLGAESYIEIPDESQPFHVPKGVMDNLLPYETLPKWY